MNNKILIGTSAAVVVIVVGACVYWATRPDLALRINQERRQGNYEEALKIAQQVRTSQTISPDERARALINATSLAYETTGDISDAIASVRELKEIANDPRVSASIRGSAQIAAVLWYQTTGSDERVYEEIFKDEPFKSYADPKSKVKSVRNVLLAADGNSLDARFSMTIAATFIKSLFELDPTNRGIRVRPEYRAEAERYLKQGRELMQTEGAEGKTSLSYLSTRYWEAYTVGGLAHFRGDSQSDYRPQWSPLYEELIRFIREEGTFEQRRLLAVSLWRYGFFLMVNSDNPEAARKKFVEAIQAVKENPNAESDGLVVLIKHLKEMKAAGSTAQGIVNLNRAMSISPEFKAFVDSIAI